MARIALAVFGLLLAVGCRSGGSGGSDDDGSVPRRAMPHDGSLKKDWKTLYDEWQDPDPIPSFALVDQDGREFSLGQYSDRYVVVGFVFTSCGMPEACPLIMKKMRGVQELWAAKEKAGETGGKRLQLISFTIDPEIDQPAVFKAWAQRFDVDHSNWTLANGPPELMSDALPSLFNVLALPGSGGQLRHTVKVALLQPGLREQASWLDNKFEPTDVVELIVDHQPAAAGG